MKTILIPTDFTAASLQVIEETIHFFRPESVDIVLFHAFSMPGSMQDIASRADKPHLQVMTEPFRKGCKRIKDKYHQHVRNICFRHMYGETLAVFKHYLTFNKIDHIIYPSSLLLQAVHPRSIHPDALFRRSGYSIIHSIVPEIIFSKTASSKTAEYLLEAALNPVH